MCFVAECEAAFPGVSPRSAAAPDRTASRADAPDRLASCRLTAAPTKRTISTTADTAPATRRRWRRCARCNRRRVSGGRSESETGGGAISVEARQALRRKDPPGHDEGERSDQWQVAERPVREPPFECRPSEDEGQADGGERHRQADR